MSMDTHAQETYKSMLTISAEGIKSLLLINGGAIVALLSFLGSSDVGRSVVQASTLPLASYALGMIFSVLTFISSYATQFFLFNETIHQVSGNVKRHMLFVYFSLFFVIASLGAFTVGCYTSIQMLRNYSA